MESIPETCKFGDFNANNVTYQLLEIKLSFMIKQSCLFHSCMFLTGVYSSYRYITDVDDPCEDMGVKDAS
jgi:hypothetical protein